MYLCVEECLGFARDCLQASRVMCSRKVVCISQTVVIDARTHMLGRLASVVAKQLLNGQHIVSQHGSSLLIDTTCLHSVGIGASSIAASFLTVASCCLPR